MALDWYRIAFTETHPLKIEILSRLDRFGRPLSPAIIARETGEPLGNVSYHVRGLAAAGLIELVGRQAVRGATEHLYALSERGRA